MAEKSVRSQANIHENYKAVFGAFGDLNIQTGIAMTNQHNPWYLGIAFPFALPSVVGGYDVPYKARWRRPENEDLPQPRALLNHWMTPLRYSVQQSIGESHMALGPAYKLQVFDLTRGLPQRIEGQYRRLWGFTPALCKLYFRECVNLGVSLSVKRSVLDITGAQQVEADVAIAAADLLVKLDNGYYTDNNGKHRKIQGDFSKVLFAEKLSSLQRRLLSDFRFRCRASPGTREIRSKIGHLGFWARVVYGNGIFCTISPGERHNYLACKLSRYRVDDPFSADLLNKAWAKNDKPNLEPKEEE